MDKVRVNASVSSMNLTREQVSARIEIRSSETPIDSLYALKGETLDAYFDDVRVTASIQSVTSGKKTTFLLHLQHTDFIVDLLRRLLRREAFALSMAAKETALVGRLLAKAAKERGTSEADLLRSLTTFTGKDGKEVEGCRRVEDLSERSREVVVAKIRKLLDAPKKNSDAGLGGAPRPVVVPPAA